MIGGSAYLEAGKVGKRDQVFILSRYLTGKVYEFYLREVSDKLYQWTMADFFRELFNSCFPIDFRIKQREKLRRIYQNDRTVREFVSELHELWNLIGDVSKREQVMKLWFGFNSYLQAELWRDKLNPESQPSRRLLPRPR